ncbi:Hypothetical Protein HFRIS_015806 [Herbaspirillum frisingense GSF30]|uniref:Regulator of ribonuclease activity B domain-containing protein n=1 Tax=Herbaspirillum frisingense GSF30 TaxID=864073 RepID=A0AAI9ID10_9BURK|nr:ribonuclease E inhibitor RraB [Herbaspirillum frisingense]EOA03837.1 Hypothetical Protein HFRIS_015806 [Herbaspirillum frisingense GSF30]
MKNIVITILMALSLTSALAEECETRNNNISLEKIQGMFGQIKNQAKWDMSAPLVWGYFFVDPSQSKLSELSNYLGTNGYNMVELFFNGKSFTLHVEKSEVHTPESLNQRNTDFSALAKQRCIRSYDGFDVGAPKKS